MNGKSNLIKDTTKEERRKIVENAKSVTKILGESSDGIADPYYQLYIDGQMELSEARQKFIEDYMNKAKRKEEL